MRAPNLRVSALVIAVLFAGAAQAQQVPDRDYRAPIGDPAYAAGEGPVVCVDEAHFNFHTLDGRFWAFGELLRMDGYRTQPLKLKHDRAALAPCAVLVISNAQPNGDEWDKYPYPTPPAFTDAEIKAVSDWVHDGGSLLLIADHMPFGGAAATLAAAFQVEFFDGFALRDPQSQAPDIFRLEDQTLRDHVVTRGRSASEKVASVRTFAGQAFRAPHAQPLLVFPSTGYTQLMPEKAWQFTKQTRRMPVGGWLQGAVLLPGKGRAAFFGEAAMFSAQKFGPEGTPFGMNVPDAARNFQLTLNVLHWLTRKL
jgi:hypothetical protein